jgi:general secretion pathway protein K
MPGRVRRVGLRDRRGPRAQRGVALLVAILLVALGTILAAAIAYENAMTFRRGAATYAFDQALLVQEGAEALAAYGLRLAQKSDPQHTYASEGWAQPLGPLEIVPGVMLTAQLEDLQGRFNLNNLVKQDGTPDPVAVSAFQQLLAAVGLEPKWAGYMVDWIDRDIVPSVPDGAEDSVYMGQTPPYRTPNR